MKRKLFFGFLVDEAYQETLAAVKPALLNFYIGKGKLLEEFFWEGERYFGRVLNPPLSLSEIELTQMHLYSLLKKLTPNYACEKAPLWLFPHIE